MKFCQNFGDKSQSQLFFPPEFAKLFSINIHVEQIAARFGFIVREQCRRKGQLEVKLNDEKIIDVENGRKEGNKSRDM